MKRTYFSDLTTGILSADNTVICLTLELPQKDNQRNVSCIPEGIYRVIKQHATQIRPYNFFRLPDVPSRTGILIHRITYVRDLRGCIGVGLEMKDINKDGKIDMLRSGEALNKMWELLPDQFFMTIKS